MPDRHLWTRHSTKTITFDGTAGLGLETSDVTVFTITGRVWLHLIAAFCTADLTVGGVATVELGVSADTDAFIAQTTASGIDVNEWWMASTAAQGAVQVVENHTGGFQIAQANKVVSQNIIITIGTADVTGGTLVFDVLYTPLTDGARLA